jgi:hypothetical protein
MKRETRKIEPRVCQACPTSFGTDGPLPFAAEVHRAGDELLITCSPSCRRKLGLPERKVRE